MRFTWSSGLYPLVLLAAAFLLRYRKRQSYFGHPLLALIGEKLGPPPRLIHLPMALELVGLVFLVVAVLDPVIPFVDHEVRKEGLNIVLVLDLSSSMQLPIANTGGSLKSVAARAPSVSLPAPAVETRLEVVKKAVVDFISHRRGDRIGLVVFSNNAYVVSPLTTDYGYLSDYVQMINERTLSNEGMTAIGEGLLLAADLMHRQITDVSNRSNVIILLTDGENNFGRGVDFALGLIREAGIKTYFIGVDVVLTATVENQGLTDAPSLVAGVEATGGRYYDAHDPSQLQQAYRQINSLEKGRYLTKSRLRDVPAYLPFALAALVALACALVLRLIPYFTELS